MDQYFIVDTAKSFDEACVDLQAAVAANGFGVLSVLDLGETLRGKGITFPEQCRVFEVCNPQQAARVLASDMKLTMALPCRISVYTQGGQTRVGMIRPEAMLRGLSSEPDLMEVAQAVESTTTAIIQEAASRRER